MERTTLGTCYRSSGLCVPRVWGCIARCKSESFPVGVRLHQGCTLSPVAEGIAFSGLRPSAFCNDKVLLALSNSDLWFAKGSSPLDLPCGRHGSASGQGAAERLSREVFQAVHIWKANQRQSRTLERSYLLGYLLIPGLGTP